MGVGIVVGLGLGIRVAARWLRAREQPRSAGRLGTAGGFPIGRRCECRAGAGRTGDDPFRPADYPGPGPVPLRPASDGGPSYASSRSAGDRRPGPVPVRSAGDGGPGRPRSDPPATAAQDPPRSDPPATAAQDPPRPDQPATAGQPSPLAPPEEGITVTGGGTELPHWTDPPTGEVPRILADDPREAEPGEDDLEAWNALGSRRTCAGGTTAMTGPTSTRSGSWPATCHPIGALDQTRSEHSDLYSFDEDFERVEAERTGAAAAVADFDDADLAPESGSSQASRTAQARARHGPHRSPQSVEPPARSSRAAERVGRRRR